MRASPDSNQEIHRHQGKLPEDVEQEQILRQEHAYHANFQKQEKVRKVPKSDDFRSDQKQKIEQKCSLLFYRFD